MMVIKTKTQKISEDGKARAQDLLLSGNGQEKIQTIEIDLTKQGADDPKRSFQDHGMNETVPDPVTAPEKDASAIVRRQEEGHARRTLRVKVHGATDIINRSEATSTDVILAGVAAPREGSMHHAEEAHWIVQSETNGDETTIEDETTIKETMIGEGTTIGEETTAGGVMQTEDTVALPLPQGRSKRKRKGNRGQHQDPDHQQNTTLQNTRVLRANITQRLK